VEHRSDSDSGGVFISYRREDSAYAAGWLYDRLRDRLGSEEIFKDVDNIRAGDDFVAEIMAAVGSCEVLLALIGKEWASACDATGARRLDDPKDFVRLEIESALARGIRIIPVLVAGARMPAPGGLPASLVPVTYRQALELSPGRFDIDAEGVLDAVENSLADVRGLAARGANSPTVGWSHRERAPSTGTSTSNGMRRAGVAVAVVVLVVAALAGLVWLPGAFRGDSSKSWRLVISPTTTLDGGCTVTATKTGQQPRSFRGINGNPATYQMLDEGGWSWDVNDPSCVVTTLSGAGHVSMPFSRPVGYGDTDAFEASAPIEATVEDAEGQGACPVELRAVDDGTLLDQQTLDPDGGRADLDPGDRTQVYIAGAYCALRIATAP
jgi:hypothetical protein